ncbi:MAG: hypothetical protein ACTSQF_07100 [Candidatus Heimdallarchaeaceae archaeon]
MGMFKDSKRFSAEGVEKPKAKVILGVITGSSWIISALLLFVDAFIVDITTMSNGQILSSDLVLQQVGTLVAPIYNKLVFTIHIITFFISLLGIISVVVIGLAFRTKSNAKIWKILLIAGIGEVFLFSVVSSIIKIIYFGASSASLGLTSAILSLIAGILFFTVLPFDDVKAGIILVFVPLVYLGVTIGSVIILLLLITGLYTWIL